MDESTTLSIMVMLNVSVHKATQNLPLKLVQKLEHLVYEVYRLLAHKVEQLPNVLSISLISNPNPMI